MRANYKICIGCHKPIGWTSGKRITSFCSSDTRFLTRHKWTTFVYPASRHHVSARTFKNPPGKGSFKQFRDQSRRDPFSFRRLRIYYQCECDKPFVSKLHQLANSSDPRMLRVLGKHPVSMRYRT